MTPDDIFAKVSEGELSGEELTKAVNELEVDQQIALKNKFTEEATKVMGEMTGVRKEKQRVEALLKQRQEELEKAGEKPEPQTPEPAPAQPPKDDFAAKFREEQKQKAIRKFVTDFGIGDDEKSKLLEQFEKMDSGKMDAEYIYEDLVGVYAFVNKDKLVEAEKERKAREATAAEEAAKAAGGASGQSPNNGNEPPKYSEATRQLAKSAGISEEAADKQVNQGTKRVYQ